MEEQEKKQVSVGMINKSLVVFYNVCIDQVRFMQAQAE